MLLLYRREDLAERWPEELGEELAALNTDVERAVRDHVLGATARGRRGGHASEVVFALVDVPYAAGRRHLVNGEPPPAGRRLVTQTLQRVLFDLPGT